MRFEITLNGNKECTAGFSEHSVLSTTVSRVKRNPALLTPENMANINLEEHLKEHIKIIVGGMDSDDKNPERGRHIYWLDKELRVGDEIIIKILGPGAVDDPSIKK